MVWICINCKKKNSNNAKKCHNKKCKEEKPIQLVKQQEQKELKKKIEDYCPICKTHRIFNKVNSKNKWACSVCHKIFKFKGKPVPKDKLIVNALNNKVDKIEFNN